MIILGLECSAVPASVAVYDTESHKLLSEVFQNIGLTHSETLMPMIDMALELAGKSIDDVGTFAISAGPGSFTGVRIGISTVKGLAAKNDINTLGLSTLEAMAYSSIDFKGIIVPIMDARRLQCYTALFLSDGEKLERLQEDVAISGEELKALVEKHSEENGQPALLVGDGAKLFYDNFLKDVKACKISSPNSRYQRASGVAYFADKELKCGKTGSARELNPVYLRVPQAERELNAKLNNK